VEGDYYVYGFFITTEKYEGDEAPIYEVNFNFSTFSHIAYEENNIQYGLTYRYPYYLEKANGTSHSGNIVVDDRKDVAFSPFVSYDFVIAKEKEFSIKISDRIETVYVYAVDNSEKRFTLVKEVTKEDGRAVISNGAVINEYVREDYRKPIKIDMTYCINVNFEKAISYVEVAECDKNHQTLYTSTYASYEDLESRLKIMTEDGARYAVVRYYLEDNSWLHDTYAIGDYMDIKLENKYGFLFTKRARIY
jgi:hypothetical protein